MMALWITDQQQIGLEISNNLHSILTTIPNTQPPQYDLLSFLPRIDEILKTSLCHLPDELSKLPFGT